MYVYLNYWNDKKNMHTSRL